MTWQTKKLGEVFDENKKSKIKVRDSLKVGKYTFFKSGDKTNFLNDFLVDGQNIFLATGGKAIVKFYNGKCAYSTDTYSIKGKELNTKFLYYFLVSIIDIINDKMFKGAAIKHLQKKDFKEIKITFPKSLKEQKRIVKVLDKAFEKIAKAKDNAKKNLQNAKDLFKSYLQSVFANPEEDWEEKKLNDISENLDNKRIPITKNVRKSGKYPYYGASGIVDYVSEYIFDDNLLLVSEDGANLLARTYPIAFSINGKTWVNNHAHVLKFQKIESQRFAEYYLNSIKIDPYVSGMAQPKLNQKMLNCIPIPYPPFYKQKSIVKKLDKLLMQTKKLEEIYKKKLLDLEELKKSVLKRAFSGEL